MNVWTYEHAWTTGRWCLYHVCTTFPKPECFHTHEREDNFFFRKKKQSRLRSLFLHSVLSTRAMATQENLPILPYDLKLRVLIIGRANAGKTSILQRVCNTTESPVIYSVDPSGDRKQVRTRPWWHSRSKCMARFNSNLRWRLGRLILQVVGDGWSQRSCLCSVGSMTLITN
jgi:hypothetical protein